MEATSAQNLPKAAERNIILDSNFNLMLANAGRYLEMSSQKNSEDIFEDPVFQTALKYLELKKRKVEKKHTSAYLKLARAAVVTAGFLTATGGAAYAERDKILEAGRGIKTPDVVFPSSIFVSGAEYKVDASTSSLSPTPTETPAPTPTPEPAVDPKILAKKEVGERNAAEFFLGDLVKQFKEIRQKKFQNDPEFARRIQKEFLNSDRINILYLGVDEEGGRDSDNPGLGRADSIMVISFDPHTFKTIAISIPRDLYSPEVAKYFPDIPKINGATMVNAVSEGTNVDSNELMKTIIENATGIPIDWTIKTNVDFIYNSEGIGIFDDLFPGGLEINVPDDIVDVDAPVVNGKPGLLFNKGLQKMSGEKILRYATERRADSDFGRADRQRQVIRASMIALLPSIMTNLVDGNTQTLDKIISALERQKNSFNLFYDVDLIKIVKTMRDNLNRLRSTPEAAVLAVLVVNTKDEVQSIRQGKEGMFISFGVDWQNGVVSTTSADGWPELSMLKVAGSNMKSSILLYWNPIRKRILELYQLIYQ